MVEMGAGQIPIRQGEEIEGRKVIKPIGAGGFGIVYEAENSKLSRREAVKEFFPRTVASRYDATAPLNIGNADQQTYNSLYRRFSETSKLLARLKHQNIVYVYDYAEANNTAYMFMEFIEGEVLRDWQAALKDYPSTEDFRRIFKPIMEALAYLHSEKMYHRDISPDNIMIERGTGRPVLIDFGTVKQEIIDEQGKNPKISSIIVGRLEYAPLEQLRHIDSPVDAYTDIFSLAATMYEFVCGQRAPRTEERLAAKGRPGANARDSYESVAKNTCVPLTEAECAAIDTAMHLWPDDRFSSIEAMMAAMGWLTAPANAATSPILVDPGALESGLNDPHGDPGAETADTPPSPAEVKPPRPTPPPPVDRTPPDAGIAAPAADAAGAAGGGAGGSGGHGGGPEDPGAAQGPHEADDQIGSNGRRKRSYVPHALVVGTAIAAAGLVIYLGQRPPDACADASHLATLGTNKAALESYIQNCGPQGLYVREARTTLDDIKQQEIQQREAAQRARENQEFEIARLNGDRTVLQSIANTPSHSKRTAAANELSRLRAEEERSKAAEEQARIEREDFEYTSGLNNNQYTPLRAYLRKFDTGQYKNSTYAKVIRDQLSALSQRDQNAWQRAQNSNRQEDYEYYISQYREGIYVARAEEAIENLSRPKTCASNGLTQNDIANQGSARIRAYYAALDNRNAGAVVSMWHNIDGSFEKRLRESVQKAVFASPPNVSLYEYGLRPPFAAFRVDVRVGDSKNPSGDSYQLRVELSCIFDQWKITKLKNWP